MLRYLCALLALLILGLVSGCETKRVLTVNPDGSGEIFERVLFPRDSYLKEIKPGEPPKMGLPLPTPARIGKNASEFGEGVEVISYKRIENEDMLGYEAEYRFGDVTKLSVNKFLQQGDDSGTPGDASVASDPPRKFELIKGEVTELRVPLKAVGKKVEEEKDTKPSKPLWDDPKQGEAAVKEAVKHIDVRIAIRVKGAIEATNSHFRSGNEVVIKEMNLKGLSADPKYADELKEAANAKTAPQDLPKDNPYMKDEDVDVLNIRFK